MAEKLVSPGVFTRENDLSFIAQGVGEIGAAIVGPFKQGPAFKPTIITTQSELTDVFGAADGTYYTELTAQNYLREAGVVTICRVAGVGGYTEKAPVLITVSDSAATASYDEKVVGILFNTDSDATSFSDDLDLTDNGDGEFTLDGITLSGSFDVSVNPSSNASIDDVFGVSPKGSKEAYVYGYFANEAETALSQSITASVNYYTLDNQSFSGSYGTGKACGANTPMIQSQLIGGNRYDLFTFYTLADGNVENTRFKVTIGNIKAAGDINGSDYGSFSVFVRAYGDSDKRQTILEQYNNVTLDPNATNYIARVIGDGNTTIDSNGKITTTGDWGNKSKYIRVEMAIASDANPVVAVPFGHDAYYLPVNAGELDSLIPAVTYNTGSTSAIAGINLLDGDNSVYLNPIPNGATQGINEVFGLDDQGGLSLTSNAIASEVAKRQFTIAFQHGFDGINPTTPSYKGNDIVGTNSQGFNLSGPTADGAIAYKNCLDALGNVDEWDINLLVLPGVNYNDHPYVAQLGIDLCENRADAFYIMDAAGQGANIEATVNAVAPLDTNYAGVYFPWVKTIDVNTNKLIAVPPSVIMPAVYANNDRLAAEWFAPAGLNRGGLMGAVAVTNRLTHAERDELYEGRVNPIAQFPGQGISAYGQKTLQAKPSALDRINVRRLLITVKKFIASTSRFLVFEQNTTDTRNRFLNAVNPYLEGIQQKQGLYAFRVVMDETNNTPDVIDRNIMKGAIFLQPTKTAEFIQIDFNILPTGASFNA
jgi:hypothetical protein